MGVTLQSKGSQIDLTGGYGMFFKIRTRVAIAWDKEFGEHYKTISSCCKNEDFKKFNKKANEILKDERFKNEDKDILDFLFASDCDGKCNYKTCKKIYDLIKDIKDDKLQLRYAMDSDYDWEDFKQLLKDCYSHRANLTWC